MTLEKSLCQNLRLPNRYTLAPLHGIHTTRLKNWFRKSVPENSRLPKIRQKCFSDQRPLMMCCFWGGWNPSPFFGWDYFINHFNKNEQRTWTNQELHYFMSGLKPLLRAWRCTNSVARQCFPSCPGLRLSFGFRTGCFLLRAWPWWCQGWAIVQSMGEFYLVGGWTNPFHKYESNFDQLSR